MATEKDDDKVEYTFPDEQQEEKKEPVKAEKDEVEFEIETVDDTPPADRGRKPATTPPADVTDEELKNYSQEVQQRIRHFTKGYHDERRAKEAAARERDEAVRVARALYEKTKALEGNLNQGQTALLETSKSAVLAEIEMAKREFREAQDAFDSEKIVEAQEKLQKALIKQDRLENNFKAPPLQPEKKEVQQQPSVRPTVKADPKAAAWHSKNSWFGVDSEMTSYTLGLHEKLVKEEGLDPTSDEYYQRIDSRLRKLFPENFDETPPAKAAPAKSSPVAPATRTAAPKKITLTQTQVALANRLGVPLAEYAKQVALEQRNNQNG